ncbi:MAG: hypothetical protein WCG92_14635 [Hyphomicrobiales bacterium]
MSKRPPRSLVFDEDRQRDWFLSGNVLESRLASWASVSPPPALKNVVWALYHLWSPATQRILADLLDEFRRHPPDLRGNPNRDGLARAIRSARQIWRGVWIDRPRAKGGRPSVWDERARFDLWLRFSKALGQARLADLKKTRSAMMKEFVAKSRRGKGYWHTATMTCGHGGSLRVPVGAVKLSSVAQLDKLLKRVERARPRGWRAKILRHYEPTLAHLILRNGDET